MHQVKASAIDTPFPKIRTTQERRFDAVIFVIFFLSGFSSLMYEVVWQRLLTLHYGVGPISITLIVSAFMAGLGIGSLVGGHLSERIRARVSAYAAIELLIGCFGIVSPAFLSSIALATAGSDYTVSFLCMFLFLITPTFLMGATLPFLTKILNTYRRDLYSTVSYLYFTNTIGGAIGALFSSYIAISFFGLAATLYIAVGINIVLSVMIRLILPGSSPREESLPVHPAPAQENDITEDSAASTLGRVAFVFAFISGFLAIGYEIVWFRIISILVKSSPYSFSTSLAVYLIGIAAGSFVINRYVSSRSRLDRRDVFFQIQVLIALSSAITLLLYFYLSKYTSFLSLTKLSFMNELHPQFPVSFSPAFTDFLLGCYKLLDVFVWPIFFMLVPTFFIGGSFPVLSSLTSFDKEQEGRTVGTVYSFCILGNVLGGVITGVVLLPFVKTETTLLLFSLVGLFLGCFASGGGRFFLGRRSLAFSAMALVILFPRNGDIYRVMHIPQFAEYETHLEEGIDGIIMTFRDKDTYMTYINGLTHGTRPNPCFYFETLEAIRYAPDIRNVLIIGYGQGSITESVLSMVEGKHVTLVEINSTLLTNLTKMELFSSMLSHPKLKVVVDDCRRFLLRTDEKYDLILIDPLRTTEAYSNNLYSLEFFEALERHLVDDGVLMVWMDEYRVMRKTIASAFRHVRAYEWLCLASASPFRPNDGRAALFLEQFSQQVQEKIMACRSECLGDENFVRETTEPYPINTDLHPVCEYYLGLRAKERLFY